MDKVNLKLVKTASNFKEVHSKVDFIELEHQILELWEKDNTFEKCREKNKNGKSGGKGHHSYGRHKGPPADIPAHIKERTSPDGKGLNLNNSQIGVKGMSIMAKTPELKNVVSMALKGNKLGDEGVRIMTQSSNFKNLEFLSLWDNEISSSPLPSFSIVKLYVTSTSGFADCVSPPTIVIFGSKFCKTVEREVNVLKIEVFS